MQIMVIAPKLSEFARCYNDAGYTRRIVELAWNSGEIVLTGMRDYWSPALLEDIT